MIYESRCGKCGRVHEYSKPVAERENTPTCCGKKTVKGIFTAPQVGAMSFGREKSFVATDGTFIDSGSQYKKWMKDNNKIPYEEGKSEAARVRAKRQKDFDKTVETAAVNACSHLTE
jgi:hypothetical protein